MPRLSRFAAAAALLLSGSPLHAQSFSNGTFDIDATGWTLADGPVPECSDERWDGTLGNPDPGCLRLNACGEANSDPTAAQTITCLQPGTLYTVKVDVRLHVNQDSGATPTGKSFGIFLDSEPATPIALAEFLDNAWHTVTASFVATASSHTIIFAAELDPRTPGGPGYATDKSYYIDNASISGTPSCVPPPAGMVGWWPLDGADPTQELIHGNSVVLTGGFAQVIELVDGSLLFNGSNTRATVADPPSGVLDPGPAGSPNGNFSVDAWMRPLDPQQPGTHTPIFSKSDHLFASGARGFLFGFDANLLMLAVADGTHQAFLHSQPMPTNVGWHHVAVTVDRTLIPDGVRFYFDGVRIDDMTQNCASVTGSLDTSTPAGIGCWEAGFSSIYHGDLDEVEMFSVALDGPVIASIANACGAGKCKSSRVHDDGYGSNSALDPVPVVYHGHLRYSIRLRAEADVAVRLYDLAGRQVAEPFRGRLGPGEHRQTWSSEGLVLPSGEYFLQLSAGRETRTSRVVVLR